MGARRGKVLGEGKAFPCGRAGVSAGQTEFGAAWKKVSNENRDDLSVKLDDPSFPAAIYASLVDADEGYSLIWSRSRGR